MHEVLTAIDRLPVHWRNFQNGYRGSLGSYLRRDFTSCKILSRFHYFVINFRNECLHTQIHP
jgi:hypothetical protein